MVLFSYTARDEKGTLLRGTLDAPDIQTARNALLSMHMKEEEMYQIGYESGTKGVEAPPGHPMPPASSFDPTFTKAPAAVPAATPAPTPVQPVPAAPVVQPAALVPAAPAAPATPVPAPQFLTPAAPLTPAQPAIGTPAAVPGIGVPLQPIVGMPAPGITPTQAVQPGFHTTIDSRSALPATSPHGKSPKKGTSEYYPFWQSLRLYAGWLLAWYGLVFALGSYQNARSLSFTIPYLDGIFRSPLVLTFAVGSFLYLLLSQAYIHFQDSLDEMPRFAGLGLTVAGIIIFALYRSNV